jgi:hypothetical protein
MQLADIHKKLNTVLADCSIESLGTRLANAQVVDENLQKYSGAIQAKEIADRTAKALAQCTKILNDGVETLKELYSQTQSLRRKATLPLSESVSPVKNEEARYLDRRAHDVASATRETNNVTALLDAMNDAKTFPEVEGWTRLVEWSKIFWKDATPPQLELLLKAWAEYEKAVDTKSYDKLLATLNSQIDALESRHGLVANPALLRPATPQEWEKQMQLLGLA